jgi:hypothetical protein
MKLKKKELLEIIDTNGELIGNNDIPEVDPNADTQANHTSDYNQKVGTQPFRYDMLGRFGFTLMPFMEGVEENQGQKELLNDLAKLMYDKYMETLEYYYRNPNKLKPDFRIHNEKDFNTQPEDKKKIDFDWAKKVVKVIEKHFENAFQEPENIDEAKVIEEKLVDKKEDEIASKTDDKEMREKKIEKIAGLINKLEKKDIDKLINLLERKK